MIIELVIIAKILFFIIFVFNKIIKNLKLLIIKEFDNKGNNFQDIIKLELKDNKALLLNNISA